MSFTRYLQTTRLSAMSRPRRCYTTHGAPAPKSAHSTLYSSTFPAMIPVFLLGSAVYLGLQLTQLKLSHEKHMEEAATRVQILEAEIDALQKQRASELESSTQADNAPTHSTKSSWRWW
ncbi:hypothetical protein HYPSUDRAFT_32198 [Hypholoma sublateritium FD-334 SS-4]|uniref:Uncharacterized protein n=1 Tax=Hypholoma sublateritium (strain FD-334 SS-4) TaxID=945553 RepID=A0A0D2N176_HYPSF|nr:hypothetical protein HYPSUDRAFT_32198 [Hypholoma sublateritium FD-334 SS-4]